jgi:hypothetical protein
MSRALDADVAKSVENVVRHLNGQHAGTVLFLARGAAGVADALDGELEAVDRGRDRIADGGPGRYVR